jgi:leader peptidase (prepilin peptidase)/N-methyltransferase
MQVILFLFGAFVFSFLNVVIERLPEKKPIIKGYPECIKRGQKSLRYIAVEVLGGLTAVGLNLYYGYTLKALTVFVLFCLLVLISFIDYDTMIIPPQLNFMILLLGIASIWTMGGISITDRLIGLFCISLPLYIIVCIVPNGFGGGDIKLMFSVGFFLGWKATVAAFFIGLILGGIYGIYLMARRKKGRNEHFAFGPFLCIGIAVAVFCGETMINAYLSSFMG